MTLVRKGKSKELFRIQFPYTDDHVCVDFLSCGRF